MNLNSYIGLLGKSFKITPIGGQSRLEECDASTANFTVPDADYLLTLDADSLVLPDYALKLVKIMEQDRTIAVAQTPYSAIPDSRNRLERAAGAQTDLQYIVHQGFTAFNATFWVGANALLRVAALRDIRTTLYEGGNAVPFTSKTARSSKTPAPPSTSCVGVGACTITRSVLRTALRPRISAPSLFSAAAGQMAA
jgi:GT2 family glycosyltransferase